MVRPEGEWSLPELYISKTNKYPNSYKTADLVCDNFGFNLCAISAENITEVNYF
jgi:hypothetical protein